jgi:hypothetical protein
MILCWNHHNLYDDKIINSINQRAMCLLNIINSQSETLLLFYIAKIQEYNINKLNYFDLDLLKNFNCNFLILIPLLNFNQDPFIYYKTNNITIIYFTSSLYGNIADINYNIPEWLKLVNIIYNIYDFNINDK